MTQPDLPSDARPDADPIEERSRIVEGLTGRLPALVGGLMLFIGCGLMFSLRNLFYRNSNAVSFDSVGTWGPIALASLVLIAPILHALSHYVALEAMRLPARWSVRLIYPRVRPAAPVSRRQAVRFFAAPFVLAGLLVLLMLIRPASGFVALIGAANLALAASDAWKILGLQRFPPATTFEVNADHCRALNTGR